MGTLKTRLLVALASTPFSWTLGIIWEFQQLDLTQEGKKIGGLHEARKNEEMGLLESIPSSKTIN